MYVNHPLLTEIALSNDCHKLSPLPTLNWVPCYNEPLECTRLEVRARTLSQSNAYRSRLKTRTGTSGLHRRERANGRHRLDTHPLHSPDKLDRAPRPDAVQPRRTGKQVRVLMTLEWDIRES